MLKRDWVRSICEAHGPAGYLQIQQGLLEGRDPAGNKVTPITPEQFSIRSLWEGLVGPVEETLGYVQDLMGFVEIPIREAVTTSAFPSAVGQLIAQKVIDGYNMPGAIGDELVTTMPSKLRGERLVGFTHLQGLKDIEEYEPYQDSTFAEKYVTLTETKRGRLLSVSEEAVTHDQTGQVLMKASQLGTLARENKERRIVRGVADVASTERVYRPSGTAEQLYSSGNSNLLSTATVLTDWTDIQEALAYHAANVTDDRETDDAMGAQPILWVPKVLLTAVKLAGTAARIVSATQLEHQSTIGGNIVRTIVGGQLQALSSSILDVAEGADQWDDADDWFIGDFKRQFVYKEIWPIQTLRAPAQNEEQFTRDIVARFKVREYGDLNCIDERYVIKVNAA